MFEVIDVKNKPATRYSNFLITINSNQKSDNGKMDMLFRNIISKIQENFHIYVIPMEEAQNVDMATNIIKARIVRAFEVAPTNGLYHAHMTVEMNQLVGYYYIDTQKMRNDIIKIWKNNVYIDYKPIKSSKVNVYNYIRKNQ